MLWAKAIAPVGPFKPANVATKWSPRRRKIVEDAYGQWLAWLDLKGWLDPHMSPAERVCVERIEKYVHYMQQRLAPVSVGMMLGALYRMLVALSPEADLIWLRDICQHFKSIAVPVRDKRSALVPSKDLFNLGLSLMESAETLDRCDYFRALRFRDGLVLALWAAVPLRIRNFSTLTLGKQLIYDKGSYSVVLDANETKTGQCYTASLAQDFLPYFDRYFRHHRQVLLKQRKGGIQPTMAVWISRFGTPMQEADLRTNVKNRTKEAFGTAMWPHLIRDCAATSIAIEDPEHVRMIAGLLGQSSFATAEKYYNQATTLEAAAMLQKGLGEYFKALKRHQP